MHENSLEWCDQIMVYPLSIFATEMSSLIKLRSLNEHFFLQDLINFLFSVIWYLEVAFSTLVPKLLGPLIPRGFAC